MPHFAMSDLGLHCLPDTLLGVSRLQWINIYMLQRTSKGGIFDDKCNVELFSPIIHKRTHIVGTH